MQRRADGRTQIDRRSLEPHRAAGAQRRDARQDPRGERSKIIERSRSWKLRTYSSDVLGEAPWPIQRRNAHASSKPRAGMATKTAVGSVRT